MTPNRKDVAEFLRLGLRYRVISIESVVAWADEVIAEDDEPPAWAIELAFATNDDVDDLLKDIAGESQDDLPVRMLLGFVHRRWNEGQMSVEAVRSIGWDLAGDDLLDSNPGEVSWGSVLYVVAEEYESGWRSIGEVRNLIDESLLQYAVYESLLPPVICDDRRAPED
jgi:hypothetical protein